MLNLYYCPWQAIMSLLKPTFVYTTQEKFSFLHALIDVAFGDFSCSNRIPETRGNYALPETQELEERSLAAVLFNGWCSWKDLESGVTKSNANVGKEKEKALLFELMTPIHFKARLHGTNLVNLTTHYWAQTSLPLLTCEELNRKHTL